MLATGAAMAPLRVEMMLAAVVWRFSMSVLSAIGAGAEMTLVNVAARAKMVAKRMLMVL